MANKKLVREIAAIISTHDNKDQYANARLAEYIIRKVNKPSEVDKAKLSERKTVHEWLNIKGTPKEEFGKSICLLRRLSIALNIN